MHLTLRVTETYCGITGMGQIISSNSHDFLSIEIVPVIASFDNDGHIKPLYIGINNESYKVESSWVRKNFANQMEFQCKIKIDNYLKPVVLTYYMNECIWSVPREKDF